MGPGVVVSGCVARLSSAHAEVRDGFVYDEPSTAPPSSNTLNARSIRASNSMNTTVWVNLPPEILELIIKLSGHSIATVIALSQVCTSWRLSLTSHCGFWHSIKFQTLSLKRIDKGGTIDFPWILKKVWILDA